MQSRAGGIARNTIVNGGGLFVLASGAVSTLLAGGGAPPRQPPRITVGGQHRAVDAAIVEIVSDFFSRGLEDVTDGLAIEPVEAAGACRTRRTNPQSQCHPARRRPPISKNARGAGPGAVDASVGNHRGNPTP
jgi:hypothetical protein